MFKFFTFLPKMWGCLVLVLFGLPLYAQASSHQPDLVIESMSLTGQTLQFTLKNNGPAAFSGPYRVDFQWQRTPGSFHPAAQPLETVRFSEQATIPPGESIVRSHTYISTVDNTWERLHFTVDPLNQIAESNESNNIVELPRATPDLAVENPRFINETISYTIKNYGNFAVNGEVEILYEWLNSIGQITGSITHSSPRLRLNLQPGQELPIQAPMSLPQRWDRRFRVTIDPYSWIRDTNRANNSAETDILRADFIVESATLSNNTVSYTVKNIGGAPYQGPLDVRFIWVVTNNVWLTMVPTTINVDLDPNETAAHTFQLTQIPRPHDAIALKVRANWQFNVPEPNIDNNDFDIRVGPPDLIIESAELDNLTLRYVVKNNGAGTSQGILGVRHVWQRANGSTVSPITYTNGAPVTLGPGETLTRTYTFNYLPLQAARLRLIADPLNRINESDEQNNTYTLDKPLPDLSIEAANFTNKVLTYQLKNLGPGHFSGKPQIRHRLERANGSLIQQRVTLLSTNLASGGRVNRRVVFSGNLKDAAKLIITIDPLNKLPEIDKTNNTTELDLQPTPTQPPSTLAPPTAPIVLPTPQPAQPQPLPTLPVGPTIPVPPSEPTPTPEPAPPTVTVPTEPVAPQPTPTQPTPTPTTPELTELVAEFGSLSETITKYRIRNEGPGVYSALTQIEYQWLNEKGLVVSKSTESEWIKLLPGEFIDRAYKFASILSDATLLRIVVDPLWAVNELNRTNNVLEIKRAITVQPTPAPEPKPEPIKTTVDLNPTSSSLTKESVSYKLVNLGSAAYSGKVGLLYYWLDKNDKAFAKAVETALVDLPAGGTTLITYIFKSPPEGAYTLQIIVDYDNLITESNEINNTLNVSLFK